MKKNSESKTKTTEMSIPKLPISFPSFVKYPLHAVAYVLLTYFVYKEFTKSDPCSDLRESMKKQEERIKAQDDRINVLEKFNRDLIQSTDNFKNALLVKNGIIDRIQDKLDSIKISKP